MAATSSAYQGITILALLVGAALLIMIAILYTKNQSTWAILDPATKTLKGPISKLALVYPNVLSSGNAFQVQDLVGAKEQFSSFIISTDPTKPYNAITSPNGRFTVAMQKPPLQY